MSTLARNAPAKARAAPGPRHVAILLATLNGSAHLSAQLASIAAQSHDDWSLIASDDGSTDGTRAQLAAFRAAHPLRRITILRGPRRGSAQNFLSLLRAAGTAPFAAFADQDDVWFPKKIARSVAALAPHAGPALYGSRTIVADAGLGPLRTSPAFTRPPDFGNALVQSIAGGNTMVLNRAALDVLQPASLGARDIVAHDWWCYQAVCGIGGRVVVDARPSLLYRQHGGNQIGANDTAGAALARLRRLARGDFAAALEAHAAALETMRDRLTPAARDRLDAFRAGRRARGAARLRLYARAGLWRQRRRGNASLWLAAALGWL